MALYVLCLLLAGLRMGAPDSRCGGGKYYSVTQCSSGTGICLECPTGSFCTDSDPCNTINVCPLGRYNPSTGQAFCLPCGQGTFSDATAASSCTPCQAGYTTAANGSTTISSCVACSAGSFSSAGGACSACSAGRYTASAASTSLSQCLPCAAGTWSGAGSGVCCAVGYWSAAGATVCAACLAGTYSLTQGAASISACLPCAAGTYNTEQRSNSSSFCLPCAAGTFNPYTASASVASCVACAQNTFSTPGSSQCQACAPSTYSASGSGVCCALGSWSAPGAALCSQCPAGTFSAVAGSTSPSSCSKCEIGSYAPTPGSSVCTLCPLGTTTVTTGTLRNSSCAPCAAGKYQDTLGAPCLDCPPNTFSAALGAIAASTCQPCPDSGSTDAAGTPSLSLCKAFQCGPGLQPSIPTPLSTRDCVPITCPAPLLLSADGTGCAGCGSSSYGTPPACSLCPANSTCPGFFTLPLSAPASLATRSSACTAASTLSLTPVVIPNQPTSFSLANIPPLVTLCTAGGLAALVFAALAYAAHSPTSARAHLESILKRMDSFSMAYVVPIGSPLLNRPTALGGACSLLSILAFLTVAAVLLLQYAYANVSVQTALNTLLSNNPFTPSVPWAPPLTSLSPPILSGVQLRLFAQEGMACDALAAGTGVSGSPSGWTVSPSVSCGDSRSLLVLSCPTCSFTATSFLKFYLPYTCQSFYLEVIAVDAQGVVNSVVFPPTSTVASPTALLSSLTWTVELLGTIVKDTIQATVTQGYQLSVSAAATTTQAVGTSIIPSKALVAVTISLPLQTYYSSIQLLPQQSLVSLLSSIVGLLGIIGLFRVLFLVSDVTLNHVALASKRRQSAAPLSRAAGQQQGGEGSSEQSNPLRRGAALAPAPVLVVEAPSAPASEAAPSLWERQEDGTDVWYVNTVTGETSWTPGRSST